MPDILLLTDARYERLDPASCASPYVGNILREDALVADALGKLGLTCARVDWARSDVAWSKARAAVFRTTWDYFDRPAEFDAWLARVERDVRLVNCGALVRWNMDKRYLKSLAGQGVPVVPTRYVDRGEGVSLAALCQETGWHEVVAKPCVSGAARETRRFRREELADHEAWFEARVRVEPMMLQPFVPSVLTEGEVSCVVIDGRCTHGVRKRPRRGDFRVQDDHGGSVEPHQPSQAQRALAVAAAAACPHDPAYVRVDLVRDPGGEELAMEVEAIEPELFLRFEPAAAEDLAAAVARRL